MRGTRVYTASDVNKSPLPAMLMYFFFIIISDTSHTVDLWQLLITRGKGRRKRSNKLRRTGRERNLYSLSDSFKQYYFMDEVIL